MHNNAIGDIKIVGSSSYNPGKKPMLAPSANSIHLAIFRKFSKLEPPPINYALLAHYFYVKTFNS